MPGKALKTSGPWVPPPSYPPFYKLETSEVEYLGVSFPPEGPPQVRSCLRIISVSSLLTHRHQARKVQSGDGPLFQWKESTRG